MARVSIEDCQEKLENRFALVMVAAHRARQLMDNSEALVSSKNSESVIALREIAEGHVVLEGEIDLENESYINVFKRRQGEHVPLIEDEQPGATAN